MSRTRAHPTARRPSFIRRRKLLALSLATPARRPPALRPAKCLGSLPGIATFVLLGSSVSMNTETGTMGFRPWTLIASAALFAGSIATSRYFNRREGGRWARDRRVVAGRV